MSRYSRLISTAAVIALIAPQLPAATMFWQGGSGNLVSANYNDGAPGKTPGAADIVNFGNGGTGTQSGGNVSFQRLRVGHNQTTPAPGGGGQGTVTIDNGAIVNLTEDPGTGAANSSLWVGNVQNGTLTIDGAGTSVTSARLAVIGYGNNVNRNGTLNITNGGSLTVTKGNILLGEGIAPGNNGVQGHIFVDGNVTAINDGNDVIIGVRSATSSFTQTGGLVNIQDVIEVGGTNSTASNVGSSFTISGGTTTHNGNFFVGRGASVGATANISGTGVLNTGNRFLMGGGTATGAVTNHSAGTLNTDLDVRIADAFTSATSDATYNLSGTGIINSTTGGIVGRQGVGKFFQTGGQANFNGTLSIGNREVAALATNGLYEISAGDLNVQTALNIAPNGTGELRVIGDDATIDVTGNFSVNNTANGVGTLAYELAVGESLSMINVTGTATFNAGAVLFVDDSNATFNQFQYDVLTASSIVDDGITFSAPSGWSYRIIDGGNGKILRIVVPEPGAAALVLLVNGLACVRRRK
jgi:hypothetical protein